MTSSIKSSLRVYFAGAAIAVAAGCAGGNGSTEGGIPAASQTVRSLRPAGASPKLYVANAAGGVVVYSTGAKPQILQTITTGVPSPGGIWVDQRGTLYAVNVPDSSYQTSLPEYRPGAGSPFRTITNGIVNCGYVAVDKHQNVYVTGVDNSSGSFFVEIYPRGQLTPARTVTIPHPSVSAVRGIAFDATDALLVGESVYLKPGVVYRLAPGSQTFTNLNLQDAPGGDIAVDKAGNLYAGTGSSAGTQAIAVYSPNSTTPSYQIAVQNILDALAVAPDGTLYAETRGGGPPQISVYAPGSGSPMQTFTSAAGGLGLALRP
ncbi:MAG: hypothetical protein JO347_08030 [Candidatus Eremiobacteraeota bacterium]|nr:hypothetical protein [Candidatus Eremiobacteraeota bacterium]